MDLHVLRCPEHDLTIFRKCLSVSRSVYMYVCLQTFVNTITLSRSNAQKVTKLYNQLHLDKIWSWLDIGGHRPIGGAAMPHFPRIFRCLKYLISLGLLHGNKPNSDENIHIRHKSFVKLLCTSNFRGRCCCIFSWNLGVFLILYISQDLSHGNTKVGR